MRTVKDDTGKCPACNADLSGVAEKQAQRQAERVATPLDAPKPAKEVYWSQISTGGIIALILFFIWGVGGLLANTARYLSLEGSVGVGTSAYVALGMLYWIGGMVLFGFLAVISNRRIDRR